MNAEQKKQLKTLLFLAESVNVYDAMIMAKQTNIFADFMDNLPTELIKQCDPALK